MQVKQNDTEELEARVTVLEESMLEVEENVNFLQNRFVGLSDDMEDVETANVLQDERLNTLEAEILDNDNDIEVFFSEILTSYFMLHNITSAPFTYNWFHAADLLLLTAKFLNLRTGGYNNGTVRPGF